MSPGDRVKVIRIHKADRAAGLSTASMPPRRLIGRIGTVRRPLTSWSGCWVSFGRAKKRRPPRWWDFGALSRRSMIKNGNDFWETEYPKEYLFANDELKCVGGRGGS